MIETALILPVFFLMAFGFIDFCLILFSMGNANFATRAAVRYASTHSANSYFPATQQGFNNIVAPFIFHYPSNTSSLSTVYYTGSGQIGSNAVGNGVYVTLTITYPFSVFGHTYTPISFTTTGCGIVLN
jgi:Flp pilus assembly protein TadG